MLTPVLPLAFVMVPAFMIQAYSTEQVFERNPILYIITFCLMAAKITNKLIVS